MKRTNFWARVGDFLMGDLPVEDRPQLSGAASAICSERRLRERVDELLRANNELLNKNRELEADARIGRALKLLWRSLQTDRSVQVEVTSYRPEPGPLAGVAE